MIDWLREPRHRVRAAWVVLCFCLVGWPATHVLMLAIKPPGATSWVFHLLLALSWLALIFTALDIIITADVRKEQES